MVCNTPGIVFCQFQFRLYLLTTFVQSTDLTKIWTLWVTLNSAAKSSSFSGHRFLGSGVLSKVAGSALKMTLSEVSSWGI